MSILQLVNERITVGETTQVLTDEAVEGIKRAAALKTHELDEHPLLTKTPAGLELSTEGKSARLEEIKNLFQENTLAKSGYFKWSAHVALAAMAAVGIETVLQLTLARTRTEKMSFSTMVRDKIKLKWPGIKFPHDLATPQAASDGDAEPTAQEKELMDALGLDRAKAAEYLAADAATNNRNSSGTEPSGEQDDSTHPRTSNPGKEGGQRNYNTKE
jgi:hypothetical protein